MNILAAPKRVCVEIRPGEYALGDLKHTTVDGEYVVHLDGECAEHRWESQYVEFLDGDYN